MITCIPPGTSYHFAPLVIPPGKLSPDVHLEKILCAPGKNILCTWQKYLVRFFHGFRVELVKCRLNMGRSTQCICLDLKSNLDTFSPDVSTHDAVAV